MDHFDFHRNLTWPQQLPSAENWKDGFSTKENIFIEKNRKFYCKLSNGIQVLTLLWKRHLKSRSRKNISFIDRVSGSTAVRFWKGSNSRSSVLIHHTPVPNAASAQQWVLVQDWGCQSLFPPITFLYPHLPSFPRCISC